MKPIATILAQLATLSLAATTLAQGTTWQPSQMTPLSFQRAAAAKIYQDQSEPPTLGLISFEKIVEMQTVTKVRTEWKTRTVTDAETGKTTTLEYAVEVPYEETVARSRIVGRRFEVPLEDARFWTVGGKSLPAGEAQTALATTKRCLLIDPSRSRRYEYQGEPFFNEMLKNDVLVIWYDKDKVKVIPAEM